VEAHWSLIIGVEGSKLQVVEPNRPTVLWKWEMNDLFLSNSKADEKKFVRFYKKGQAPGKNEPRTIHALPKNYRGKAGKQGTDTIYDLGGLKKDRHEKQELKHVLVAVVPPDLAAS
jgi:hypothetical protein